MLISEEKKRHFIEHGYVILENAIPRERIEAVRRVINYKLGQGFDPEQREIFAAQSYFPELREDELIKGLVTDTGVYRMAEEITSPGSLRPVQRGQLAIRFPKLDDKVKQPGGHIDGTPSPTNGVPPGTIYSFTLLVGVALSDVQRDWAGNFSVWPGSHHLLEKWFQEHDLQEMVDGAPKLDYGEPVQLHWRAGDVVFVHHKTLHAATLNNSPDIRYALFYRLHHVNHEEHREAAARDIWMEFPGLAGLTAEAV